MSNDRHILISFLAITALMTGACGAEQSAPPVEAIAVAEGQNCSLESLRNLPDVRITSVTEESAPAPHCKVAGVIGTETNFELLLPDD
jgi:feruloyl esterase